MFVCVIRYASCGKTATTPRMHRCMTSPLSVAQGSTPRKYWIYRTKDAAADRLDHCGWYFSTARVKVSERKELCPQNRNPALQQSPLSARGGQGCCCYRRPTSLMVPPRLSKKTNIIQENKNRHSTTFVKILNSLNLNQTRQQFLLRELRVNRGALNCMYLSIYSFNCLLAAGTYDIAIPSRTWTSLCSEGIKYYEVYVLQCLIKILIIYYKIELHWKFYQCCFHEHGKLCSKILMNLDNYYWLCHVSECSEWLV